MLSPHGYCLPIQDIDNINKHKKNLTVKPVLYYDIGCPFLEPKPFPVYRITKTHFYMPKYYGLKHFGIPKNSNERLGNVIECKFNGMLRSDQQEVVETTLKHLHQDGRGILSLYCGYGKTTLSLYILAQLGVKTLILVHTDVLLDQWQDRINQFLPNMRIGILKGPKQEIEDKDIVIGMLQSISKPGKYESSLFNSFGFTIIDECHHVPSKCFSQALFKVPTRYMLGLSATPKRKDKLDCILNWHLGQIIVEKRDRKKKPKVEFIMLYNPNPNIPLTRMGKPNMPQMINNLTEDTKRNQVLIEKIQKLVIDNRRILILSDRVEHCGFICNKLNQLGIIAGELTGRTSKNKDKKKQILEATVIVATYPIAHEGFDADFLDTIILATPRTDVEQSVGRILREGKCNNQKNYPLLIDVVDNFSMFQRQYYKRKRLYKSLGYLNKKQIKEEDDQQNDNNVFIKFKGCIIEEDE